MLRKISDCDFNLGFGPETSGPVSEGLTKVSDSVLRNPRNENNNLGKTLIVILTLGFEPETPGPVAEGLTKVSDSNYMEF